MRVLVTGSAGRIGRHLAGVLDRQGYGLRGFDTRADTQAAGGPIDDRHVGDLRNLPAVRSAMRGVETVVHLGAIPSDRGDGAAVMQTNVMGSWNVLQAAQENGVRRVVFFSSINAQGSVLTGHPPAVLPIDDDYPHHPATPYQLSKHLGEEMCRSFSERHGMITLCWRPTTRRRTFPPPNCSRATMRACLGPRSTRRTIWPQTHFAAWWTVRGQRRGLAGSRSTAGVTRPVLVCKGQIHI